jgi:hypothetical protein
MSQTTGGINFIGETCTLTDAQIKQLKAPKMQKSIFDGAGLYLEVTQAGKKY